MNLAESIVVLRPRTIAEIFDLACRVCARPALALYLRLSAMALLPGFALCMALRYALDWEWALVWCVAALWGTVAQGLFTVAAGKILFAPAVTAREVLSAFGRRFGSYLGALFVSRLLLVAGSFLFFLLLPSAWIRMLFVHEASLLEGAPSVDAVKRSSRFAQGRGALVFQVLALLVLAQVGFAIIAELLADGLIDGVLQLGKPFGALFDDGGSPAAVLGFLLAVPYLSTARFLQYIDVRTRADGWDIQVRFMAVASREGETRRAAA